MQEVPTVAQLLNELNDQSGAADMEGAAVRATRAAPCRARAQRSGAEPVNAPHQEEDFEKTSLRDAVATFHSTFLDALLLEVRPRQWGGWLSRQPDVAWPPQSKQKLHAKGADAAPRPSTDW